MLSVTRRFAALLALLVCSHAASAAVSIQYTVVPMGGNVYRYVYSITNNGPGASLQLFDILFDTSLYLESSLQIVSPPAINAQWSQQILHSVPFAIPAAYDALAIAGGIPAGATVSGFSVQFTWLGSGTPGAQPFQVFDPITFALLQSGNTTAAQVAPIPSLSTWSFGLLGLALAGAATHQMRLRTAEVSRSRSPER